MFYTFQAMGESNLNEQNKTRIGRFEKRRKNTKSISILLILGVLLLFIFLWFIIFGGNDQDTNESTDAHQNVEEKNEIEQSGENPANHNESTNDDELELTEDEDQNEISPENDNDETSNEINIEQVEPSDDNVIEAYTGNWPAIPTEQSEPDILNFDKDTQNRAEMEAAIRSATDLDENMVVWWLSNGGNQQVIATVSDRQETDINRVYIQWHDGQGWQAFKVEKLKENDQKWRFE